MSVFHNHRFTRRAWLASQGLTMAGLFTRNSQLGLGLRAGHSGWLSANRVSDIARQSARLDPAPWQALAQRAVDAARAAGAQYADARLTRTVVHEYGYAPTTGTPGGHMDGANEVVGVGVRVLMDGYWGFSASAVITPDEVVRLAQDAVTQAQENAKGTPWKVDLGTIPVATGTWTTPVRIDPFTIPIEEKLDFITYWKQCADQAGVVLVKDGMPSWFRFARQERVLATSEGGQITQTIYESGGAIHYGIPDGQGGYKALADAYRIDMAGAGWERLLDAKIPEQLPQIKDDLAKRAALSSKPSTVGRYTLVCDGATMASIVEQTLGVVTQLDRALGYEANAGGTSFIDDPLTMIGNFAVTSPLVTVTANRSAPMELATVKWDDEGVAPQPFRLIKDGILTDFQTTREQAAWLAPYYQQHNQPVHSHGCAATESAHVVTQQMMPNMSMEPSASDIRLEDMVANVKDGIFIEGGQIMEIDFQARTGLLAGSMREITNGRLGQLLAGGAILFNSQELWKNVKVVGGTSTQAVIGTTCFGSLLGMGIIDNILAHNAHGKGQPSQLTSHSVRAVAATVSDQAVINPMRKA